MGSWDWKSIIIYNSIVKVGTGKGAAWGCFWRNTRDNSRDSLTFSFFLFLLLLAIKKKSDYGR